MSAGRDVPTVAIVGGGFSGAAIAFHLARAGARANILVFEPRARLGGGLAYGGDDPVHRVNVPATRMSILPDVPEHFARWLDASDVLAADPAAFAGGEAYPRRREFGRYVEETLRPFVASGAVALVRDRVVHLRKADGWRIGAADGRTFRADFAVIATTHPSCALPSQLHDLNGDPGLIADPLADDAIADVEADERVLIVGAGLTAADLVAALDAKAHRGPITLISRRGLRARGRSPGPLEPRGDFLASPSHSANELLRRIRAAVRECEAEGGDWEPVIETVRNQGQGIWRALDLASRKRVVRHLRPFWDVHRFRAAPQIDAILDRKIGDGSLTVRRARLGLVARAPSGLAVELRDNRRGASETQAFDRIVVAVGPSHRDVLASQPFLAELARAGLLRIDATALGLWTSREARAVGANGAAEPTLFVAGPLARGTFGELMGLPQVSEYAQFVADQVAEALRASAHRVQAPA